MFQERCYERDNDINNNFYADNMTNNIEMNNNDFGNYMDMNQGGCQIRPLVEPLQERVVNRTIMHEVPQE